jgi:lambda family phage portal protein
MHARDLCRNVGWARKARRVIATHTVGWGIVPRPRGEHAKAAAVLWKDWAESPSCSIDGRSTFYAMQYLAIRTIFEAGEVLIRRYVRPGAPVPLRLQVLEPDHLDTAKDLDRGEAGGPIIQGVEFAADGSRAAYWLFPVHPGNTRSSSQSRRVPAADVLHVYDTERAGQARGISWLGAAIVPMKDLDEFEDAELMKQKIAACFAAFVTDLDGAGTHTGLEDEDDDELEVFEPGMIKYLPPGKEVTTASPPAAVEAGFTARHLRKAAAAMGVTYEDLTGDYSQVNFSSARMARLVHWGDVYAWQHHMMIPLLCRGVWEWFVDAAGTAGNLRGPVGADWTPPPMPMIEPAQEGLALQRLVRTGAMTHNEMVRQQGGDPESHWDEFEEGLKALDARGIKLDSDPRATSAAGLTQERVGLGGGSDSSDETPPG